MGTYKEPRPPGGEPTDGERDVWLDAGKIKLGHWSSGTNAWVVDKELAYDGGGFSLSTHTHGGTFEGDADTLDGSHAAAFAAASHTHTILTKNVYRVYDYVSLSVGDYTIDLDGHVPDGTKTVFLWYTGCSSGGTGVAITNYAGTEVFSIANHSTGWDCHGSCFVPLDFLYRFRMLLSGSGVTYFALVVTYVI